MFEVLAFLLSKSRVVGYVWLIYQLVERGKDWRPRERFCLSPWRNFDFRKRFSFLVTTLSLKPRPNKVNGKKSCHFINYLGGETKLRVSFLHSFLRSRILSKWCKLNLEAFEDNQRKLMYIFIQPLPLRRKLSPLQVRRRRIQKIQRSQQRR